MQTQYVLKQAGLTLPVTKLFKQHIATLLAEQSQQTSVRAVVIMSFIISLEIFHLQQRRMNFGHCGRVILWNISLWIFTR